MMEGLVAASMQMEEPEVRTLVDNDRVRAVYWAIPPGGETGWHRHERDYLSVQVTDGRLRIESKDGVELFVDLTVGATVYVNAPVEHNVVNAGPATIATVDIELK